MPLIDASRLPLVFVLATVAGFAAPAATADEQEHRPTLVVSGTGTVDVPADRAIISFGIVAQSEEAAGAQEQVNDVMEDAIDAVKKAGVADKHIQTTNLSMHPVYERHKSIQRGEAPKIVAYRASYTLQVTVDQIDQSGDVIDAALGAGVNTFQGIRFTLKDDAAAKETALKKAAGQARAKAKTIAESMGVKLAGIDRITEGGSIAVPLPRPYAARMEMDDAAMATPVQPGQLKVQASLTVHYRIAE